MEPAERFARREALSASNTLRRMVAGLLHDLEGLRKELDEGDQDASYFAQSLDYINADFEQTRTEASRWVFMEQVTHAR